ncbi:MAG: DUF4157 domain-containing protein [Spirulina sp. SIO3F2]|nr:DUF4157 domain-containing protein [Spirulina sp. SIO3F2]
MTRTAKPQTAAPLKATNQQKSNFAPPPVLQPKPRKQQTTELPEWKPEGSPETNVLQTLKASALQAKLTIGQPNDKHEQQADQVARQVVQQINTPNSESNAQQSIASLQPSALVQAKSALTSGAAPAGLESAINRARGSGQPLEASLQQSMRQAMGADFSGVRVHTDGRSDQMNQSIQAKAFTTGADVFFKKNAYQPGSRMGQELIAHELTHVVQQGTASTAVQRTTDTVIQRTLDVEAYFKKYKSFQKAMGNLAKQQNKDSIDPTALFNEIGYGGQDELTGLMSTGLAFLDPDLDPQKARSSAKIDLVTDLSIINQALGDVEANQVITASLNAFTENMSKNGIKMSCYRDPSTVKLTVISESEPKDFENQFKAIETIVCFQIGAVLKGLNSGEEKLTQQQIRDANIKLLKCVPIGSGSQDEKQNDLAAKDDASIKVDFITSLEQQLQETEKDAKKYTIKNHEKTPDREQPKVTNDQLLALYCDRFKAVWQKDVSNDAKNIDAAWKQAEQFVNRDLLTDLYTASQRAVAKAEIYDNDGADAKYRVYTVIDISNLRGLNQTYGKEESVKIFKGMVDIVDKQLRTVKNFSKLEGYHHGGDEFSYYLLFDKAVYQQSDDVVSTLNCEVEEVLSKAQREVYAYVDQLRGVSALNRDHGLKGLEHAKGDKGSHFAGTGIYYGHCNTSKPDYIKVAGEGLEVSKKKMEALNKKAAAKVAENKAIEKQKTGDPKMAVYGQTASTTHEWQ